MKMTESQLYSALNEFIDRSIMPLGASMNLQEQFLFGFKMGIVRRRLQDIVKVYLTSNESKVFKIIDENGYIDIEILYQSASDVMSQMKQLDVAGFTFKEADLQTLYGIMQKYATIN